MSLQTQRVLWLSDDKSVTMYCETSVKCMQFVKCQYYNIQRRPKIIIMIKKKTEKILCRAPSVNISPRLALFTVNQSATRREDIVYYYNKLFLER